MGTWKGKATISGLIRTLAEARTRVHRLATWFTTPQVRQPPHLPVQHLKLVRGSGSGVTDGYTKAVEESHPSILPPLDRHVSPLDTGIGLLFGTTRFKIDEHLLEHKEATVRRPATDTPSMSRLFTEVTGLRLIEEYGITSSDLALHFIRCSTGLSAHLDTVHGAPERSTPNGQ